MAPESVRGPRLCCHGRIYSPFPSVLVKHHGTSWEKLRTNKESPGLGTLWAGAVFTLLPSASLSPSPEAEEP